uniref:Uncharacterized protein n=1 Tax=Rhizophora mucronata TaxID=61149 RepID=A0A2P2IT05_RHIMU
MIFCYNYNIIAPHRELNNSSLFLFLVIGS